MTSKQRAYLKGLAQTMEPIFQIGKNSLTPENTKAIAEALEARELIKISVLQNTDLDQLSGFQCLCNCFCIFRCQTVFTNLEDRLHSLRQSF